MQGDVASELFPVASAIASLLQELVQLQLLRRATGHGTHLVFRAYFIFIVSEEDYFDEEQEDSCTDLDETEYLNALELIRLV